MAPERCPDVVQQMVCGSQLRESARHLAISIFVWPRVPIGAAELHRTGLLPEPVQSPAGLASSHSRIPSPTRRGDTEPVQQRGLSTKRWRNVHRRDGEYYSPRRADAILINIPAPTAVPKYRLAGQ